jgi:hypothetical protein
LGGANGNEMHIYYWKNIFIRAKVIQLSDVAHGPLVHIPIYISPKDAQARNLSKIEMKMYL